MAASNGRMIVEKPLRNAMEIPRGIPMINHTALAAMIIAIVGMISSQRPNVPMKKKKKPYKKPEKPEEKYQPSRITIRLNSHHGNHTNTSAIPLIVLDEMRNIKSNN